MNEEDVVVVEDRPTARGFGLRRVSAPSEDLATGVLLLLVIEWVEPLEVYEGVEHLSAFVEGAAGALNHLWVRVCTKEEEVAVLLGPYWVGRGPIAVNVEVLIVESGRRVVPLCHLDGAGFVTHVDQVKSVRTAVCIVVVGYRIQLRVCQLVVD